MQEQRICNPKPTEVVWFVYHKCFCEKKWNTACDWS